VHLDRIQLIENNRFADIHISIEEGQPDVVNALAFEGALILKEEDLRKDLLLKRGAPFNASLLEPTFTPFATRASENLAVSIADSVRNENLAWNRYIDPAAADVETSHRRQPAVRAGVTHRGRPALPLTKGRPSLEPVADSAVSWATSTATGSH